MATLSLARRRMMPRATFVVLTAALTFSALGTAIAGDWHKEPNNVCTDCHTQHNSENGQPMRTDNNPTPAAHLLLRATAQDLCLSCHDGSKPGIPNVVSAGSGTVDWAGGTFPLTDQATSTTSHHLSASTPEVPPGGTIAMIVTCTTCHDPHGNNNYRNLRPDPTRTNLAPVTVMTAQTLTANGSNASQVYVYNNIFYQQGISAWCGQCHGATDPGTGHPVDLQIFKAKNADYSQWITTNLPRVPVNSPTDNVIPSKDDQVNCLSCHKAHGSTNPNTLIYADGISIDSTCQECHNQ